MANFVYSLKRLDYASVTCDNSIIYKYLIEEGGRFHGHGCVMSENCGNLFPSISG